MILAHVVDASSCMSGVYQKNNISRNRKFQKKNVFVHINGGSVETQNHPSKHDDLLLSCDEKIFSVSN